MVDKLDIDNARKIAAEADKNLVVELDAEIVAFQATITKMITDNVTEGTPASPAIQFLYRVQGSIQSVATFDLASLKTQYGVVDTSLDNTKIEGGSIAVNTITANN